MRAMHTSVPFGHASTRSPLHAQPAPLSSAGDGRAVDADGRDGVVTYVTETPLRRASPTGKRRAFVPSTPLEGSLDEDALVGLEPHPPRRPRLDWGEEALIGPAPPPSRSTAAGTRRDMRAQQSRAWQGAGLHTRGVKVLQQYPDHPFLFERQCLPVQPAEEAWVLPPEPTPAQEQPFFLHPKRMATRHAAAMATAFSAATGGLFNEAGVPVPVFAAVEGGPPATALDSFGAARLPGGVSWSSVVFDEARRPIQWPWERGAPAPQRVNLMPTAENSDPASAFFVDTTAATSAGTHALDATVNEGLRNATAKGDGGENSTGTRGWKSFCRRHGRAYNRPIDPLAPLAVKLDEEQWCMRFVAHMIDSRDIEVATAKGYFHAASGWHKRKHGIGFAGGLDMQRLPEMIKGLRRVRDKPHEAKVRRGVAPQKLRVALDKLFPRGTTRENANIRAMVTSAFQGLLRGREVCKADGKEWDAALDLARGDIAALLEDRLVFFVRPAKNMKYTKGKTVPIVIGAGGEFIDAHAEMAEMLRVDPVSRTNAAGTPMFRHADGSAFSVAQLRDIVKALMRCVGEPAEEFGAHSLRIGGATALFAAGADPIVIKTMGRWSSDCFRLYVRACFEQTLSWTRKAGSSTVNDVAGMTTVVAEVDAIFGEDDA